VTDQAQLGDPKCRFRMRGNPINGCVLHTSTCCRPVVLLFRAWPVRCEVPALAARDMMARILRDSGSREKPMRISVRRFPLPLSLASSGTAGRGVAEELRRRRCSRPRLELSSSDNRREWRSSVLELLALGRHEDRMQGCGSSANRDPAHSKACCLLEAGAVRFCG